MGTDMNIIKYRISMNILIIRCLLICCILAFCLITTSMAQTDTQSADSEIRALKQRLDGLKELSDYIGVAFAVFGGMATIAGFIGVISWIRTEQKFSSLYEKVSSNIDLVNQSLEISNKT